MNQTGILVLLGAGFAATLVPAGCGHSNPGEATSDGGGATHAGGAPNHGGSGGRNGDSGGGGGAGEAGVPPGPGLFSVKATPPKYVGAFIPSTVEYAGDHRIAMGTSSKKMFSTGLNEGTSGNHHVGEIGIPQLSTSTNLDDIPIATVEQDWVDYAAKAPASGNMIETPTTGGLFYDPSSGRLIIGTYVYYDAAATEQRNTVVFRNASNLADSPVDGAFHVDGEAMDAGFILPIPAPLQAAFGGTHFMGFGGFMPIVSRASAGPSAYVMKLSELTGLTGTTGSVSATPALVYPYGDDTMLSTDPATWSGGIDGQYTSLSWNHLTSVPAAFVVPGTRTLMYVGQNWDGRGIITYKGTNDLGETYGGYGPSLHDALEDYYWLYDLDDLKASIADPAAHPPWRIRPYEHGKFTPDKNPFGGTYSTLITGACFDETTSRLYVTLTYGAYPRFPNGTPLIAAFTLGQ